MSPYGRNGVTNCSLASVVLVHLGLFVQTRKLSPSTLLTAELCVGLASETVDEKKMRLLLQIMKFSKRNRTTIVQCPSFQPHLKTDPLVYQILGNKLFG